MKILIASILSENQALIAEDHWLANILLLSCRLFSAMNSDYLLKVRMVEAPLNVSEKKDSNGDLVRLSMRVVSLKEVIEPE